MTAPGATQDDGPLLVRGVTVVDTRDGSLTPNSDINIAGGVIAAITPTDPATPIDPALRVVDAPGAFVVPGYLDMHAHPLGEKDPRGALELMLAHGVTGFRQMSGSETLLAQRRTGTLPLPVDSPALLAVPGALLTPLNAGTADDAIAAIRQQKTAGADFIKVGLVTPEVFFPAQAEAKRLGIPIVGHLPAGIDVAAASRGGMKSIEHLGPGATLLAACSSVQEELSAAIAKLPAPSLPSIRLPFRDRILNVVLRKIVVNPINRSKPASIDILQRAIDTFDEQKAADLAAHFVTDGTWQSPTLIRVRTQEMCDAPEFSDDPDLAYMDPATVKTWQGAARSFGKFSPAAKATFCAAYDLQLRLTKLFVDAGVPILAGTDAVGAAWVIPGSSIHREFDELARAGLHPLAILQAATLRGAQFLGTTTTLGSVDVGKNADLVLLADNPIEDAANLHKVIGLVRGGRHYSPADLDRLKNRIRSNRSVH